MWIVFFGGNFDPLELNQSFLCINIWLFPISWSSLNVLHISLTVSRTAVISTKIVNQRNPFLAGEMVTGETDDVLLALRPPNINWCLLNSVDTSNIQISGHDIKVGIFLTTCYLYLNPRRKKLDLSLRLRSYKKNEKTYHSNFLTTK